MNGESPLDYPDFNKMWLGNFVSRIGTEMTFGVAVPYEVYELTNRSAHALGLIGLARGIPIMLMALVGGVVADAVDRRRLLMLTQVLFGALSAVLAVAAFRGFMSVALLYGVTVAGGVLVALDLPARQALLPNLVPREVFPKAVSLNATTFQLAAVVGPFLGGVVLARGGTPWIYAVDAATFLVLFLAIALVRYRSTERKAAPTIAAIFEGVKFVWSHGGDRPILWATMTLDFLATFFAGAMLLMPKFVLETLAGDKETLGFILAAPALGAALVAIVLSRFPAIRQQGAAILGGVAVYGVASALFGIARDVRVAFFLLALAGAGDAVSMIVRNTLRQELTPDSIRARMVSFNMIFFVGGPLLGEYEAGVVAKVFGDPDGVRISIISGGAACVLCVLLYLARYPWLAKYERAPSTPRTP